MNQAFDNESVRKERCGRCGTFVPANQIIIIERGSISPAEHICNDCNNQSIANKMGVNYFPLRKKTLSVTNEKGKEHQFVLTQVIHNTGIGIIAEEITDENTAGYRFSVQGNFDEKQQDILEKLTQKIKRNTSIQYISVRKFAGHSISTVNGFKVAGRLESTASEVPTGFPTAVIDGKVYSWEELGRILTRFEGFQFKIDFMEMTDEL